MRMRVFLLTLVFMISSMSPVIATDTVTTVDTEISGNYTLTGNITVSKGTTLTLKPGAIIDMQNYWIEVDGTLIANDVEIMSSIQSSGAGSHNSGVWDDITITPNGTASIHNTTISNAKSCLINDGTLQSSNLSMQDCIIGLENSGTASITDFDASQIDQEGMRNTGTATLANVEFNNMSGGIKSSSDIDLTGATFSLVGYGLSLSGGTYDVSDIHFGNSVAAGVSIFSGASGQIDGMTGSAINAITSIDSTGFTFANIDMTGSRLINSWSAGDLTLNGVIFDSSSAETPIDIITSGTVSLSNVALTGSFSSNQGVYNAPWIGISLSGSGDYIIADSTIEASDIAVKASGSGTLTITNSEFLSDRVGMSFNSLSETDISDTTINLSTGSEIGLDILQGVHTSSNLEINIPFNAFATTTTGIEAWYSEFNSQSLTVNGFAESFLLHESIAEFDDLSLMDSSVLGLGVYSSSVMVNDLFETRTADTSIEMENSMATIRSWSATNHDNGATIDPDSELTVWMASTLGTQFYDAKGDGVLNYGTNQNLVLDVSSSNRMWDVTVSFEDLVGNQVDADWEAMGFEGVANSGSALVPALESGSEILARYAGVGTVATTTGTEGGTLTIQVPIMPQGDWLLPTGQTIVLGATDDGLPHTATGNITIPANSHLIIESSTLEIPSYAKLKLNTLSSFDGVDAAVIGDIEIHSEGFASNYEIPSLGETDLSVEGDMMWTSCQNSNQAFNLVITGDVQLDNSCEVTITSGNVNGEITVGVGATFEVVNTLELQVLDKGEPVEGATISVQGQTQSVTTDEFGMATRTASSIIVDSSGVTQSYIENITMQWGDITEYITWNPISSRKHIFTVSTISGGTLNDYLQLERIWSPYYLSSDLVIPSDQTMSIGDGVALRVSDGVTITVEGVMNAGYSTISSTGGGARWGGLIVGDTLDTQVNLLGTNLVEGSPLVSITDEAEVVISNALISRSGGAEPLIRINAMAMVTISSSTLSDSSSSCIEVQTGEVWMSNSELKNCADDAIWARGSWLTIDDISADGDIHLEGVEGSVEGLDAENLELSSLDGFEMKDLTLSSLSGADNREVMIEGIEITTSPGIDLDNTAGSISDVSIDCGGTGIGLISHHGRSSASLVISDGSITSCTKGVDLHTDGESAPMMIHNLDISASVAIASDGNHFQVYGGSLVGSVDVSNSEADLYDVEPSMMTVFNGEIMVWANHVVTAVLGTNPVEVEFEVLVSGDLIGTWTSTYTGSSIEVSIPHILVRESETEVYDKTVITTTSTGLPSTSNEYDIGLDEEDIITIQLIANQAPAAEIVIPDEGFRAMETEVIEIRAVISDDLDSVEDLDIEWNVLVGQTSVMKLSGEWNNITDLPEGLYVLSLEVTDSQGASTTDTLSFEITLLDSDDDWTSTCNSETWYDKDNNLNCGPDIYDSDDDNDGSLDNRDAWPLDACASLDTDGDGQPDDLHCPPGITTWLTVDADDDGDGIPDSMESSNNADAEEGSSLVILTFVFLFVGAAILLLRRKQEVQ